MIDLTRNAMSTRPHTLADDIAQFSDGDFAAAVETWLRHGLPTKDDREVQAIHDAVHARLDRILDKTRALRSISEAIETHRNDGKPSRR